MNSTLKPTMALLAAIFGITLSVPVIANEKMTRVGQTTEAQRSAQTSATAQKQPLVRRDMRLSQLIGKDVRNAQGEDLGDIKDVILDINNGRVHYVILSFGGVLGLGDKLFAYPMRAFSPASNKTS